MSKNSTTEAAGLFAGEAWFDPIEAALRERVRGFLEELVEQEATAALGRRRYQRGADRGYRNGRRSRRLLGSFGPVEVAVYGNDIFNAITLGNGNDVVNCGGGGSHVFAGDGDDNLFG